MGGTLLVGKTPLIRDLSSGLSSEMSFGTTVSQKLRRMICCSKSSVWGFSTFVSTIAFRLSAPAEFSTDFSDRRPKS